MKILKIFAVCFVLMNYSMFIFVCTSSALSKTQMTTKTNNVNKLQTVLLSFKFPFRKFQYKFTLQITDLETILKKNFQEVLKYQMLLSNYFQEMIVLKKCHIILRI